MRGDQLTWHWQVPSSHPYADGIDFGFREGFAGSAAPKADSEAEAAAHRAGVKARDELRDESRRFSELRVYLTDDDRVAYELTERTD